MKPLFFKNNVVKNKFGHYENENASVDNEIQIVKRFETIL